jgi:hypothetical protein
MPAAFVPKPLPYGERLVKAHRIVKAASFRNDQRLAIREICEALTEILTALLDREGINPDAKKEDEPKKPQ